jgi:hypothetical protein
MTMPASGSSLAQVNGIELAYQVLGEASRSSFFTAASDRSRCSVPTFDINVVPALSAAVIPFLDGS